MVFRGGHQWAPKAQVEEAFDWMEQWTYFTLPAETSTTAKSMYLAYADHLVHECNAAHGTFERFEGMERAIQFAASHELENAKSFKTALANYRKEMAGLTSDETVKKEVVARDAFMKAAVSEETGRRAAGRNVEKGKAAVAEARKLYQTVADDHANTVYGAKASAAVERLKIELPD